MCHCVANILVRKAFNTNSCILQPFFKGGRKVGFKIDFAFLSKQLTPIWMGRQEEQKKQQGTIHLSLG